MVVLVGCGKSAPPTPTAVASTSTSTSTTTTSIPPVFGALLFDVADDVPPAELALVRNGISLGQQYLAANVGGDIPEANKSRVTIKVVATGLGNPNPGSAGSGCTALDSNGLARPFFDVRHQCWNAAPRFGQENHKLKTAAHEYSHAWQNQTGCNGRLTPGGRYGHLEGWITEGEGEFVGSHALMPSRLQRDYMLYWHMDVAITNKEADAPLSTHEYLMVPYVIWPGDIGYVALEWLTAHAPEGRVLSAVPRLCRGSARPLPVGDGMVLAHR